MHPELLAMWCLPCYSGEKYPKVPYSQPPLHALCSPSKGQEAAQAKACRQACLTLNPHPSTDKVGIRGCTGRVQGP